jgi:tetratricopeptide (TPR) repeat protein
VLREDWATLAGREEPAEARLVTVVTALRGHALLALNRNNDSLCTFRTLRDPAALREWRDWTGRMSTAHRRSAVMHYLAGDALARLADWDGAIEAFTRALRIRPGHALALNARGTALIAKGRWDDALLDFDAAERSEPAFADAPSSRGTLWLARRNGLDGARMAFDRAVSLSPEFVLALTGRIHARGAAAEWDGFERDVTSVARATPCAADLVADGVVRIAEYMNGSRRPDAREVADVGTTVDRAFQRLVDNATQGNYNRFVDSMRGDPDLLKYGTKLMADYAKSHKVEAERFVPLAGNSVGWNSGPASVIENFFSGLKQTFKFEGKAGAVKATSETTYNGEVPTQRQSTVTAGNLVVGRALDQALAKSLGRSSAGGVTSNMAAAPVDLGDWPFVAHYGLLYAVTSDAVPTEGSR